MDIYTDGGCHGNPGPGAWAFAVQLENNLWHEVSGSQNPTTNNRMELTAVIRALEFAATQTGDNLPIRIITDSQYVKQGILVWIKTWLRNGWKTAAKDPVKNQDLWQRLHELHDRMSVDWHWVPGHAGNPGNERCDQLVQAAIRALEAGPSLPA